MRKTIKYSNTTLIVLLLIFTLVLIGFPLLTILALNTLFPLLAIPITIGTWASMFWFWMVFGGIGVAKVK